MNRQLLRDKAKALLARRALPSGIGFYVRRHWRRKLLLLSAQVVCIAALWSVDQHTLAVAFAGFFIGRSVRDVEWWRALSSEWPDTVELLDWERVARIADGTSTT